MHEAFSPGMSITICTLRSASSIMTLKNASSWWVVHSSWFSLLLADIENEQVGRGYLRELHKVFVGHCHGEVRLKWKNIQESCHCLVTQRWTGWGPASNWNRVQMMIDMLVKCTKGATSIQYKLCKRRGQPDGFHEASYVLRHFFTLQTHWLLTKLLLPVCSVSPQWKFEVVNCLIKCPWICVLYDKYGICTCLIENGFPFLDATHRCERCMRTIPWWFTNGKHSKSWGYRN